MSPVTTHPEAPAPNPSIWRRLSRRARSLVVAVVAATVALTLVPGAPAQAKSYPVVPSQLFGMHFHNISNEVPRFRVGSLRLWDTNTHWAVLNPAPGVYNWDSVDRALNNANAAGVYDIQYAFGGTPGWAISRANLKKTGSEYSVNVDAFVAFASALASHTRGRISSFDMWNEGSLKISFQGSSKELADITIRGSRAIKAASPGALTLMPSTTYGVWLNRPKWWKDVTLRVKRAGWPVDAMNIHPYSKKPSYLANREKTIKKAKSYYRKYGFKRGVWDTEIGMGDRRGFAGWKQIVYTGDTAAGLLARTYLDSMRLGVPRAYWYGWDSHVMGLDMIDPQTKQLTAAGFAFGTIQDWMVGKQWRGCTTKKSVRTCTLVGPDGVRMRIVHATSKTRTVTLPAGVGQIRYLNGGSAGAGAGQRISVGPNPIALVG